LILGAGANENDFRTESTSAFCSNLNQNVRAYFHSQRTRNAAKSVIFEHTFLPNLSSLRSLCHLNIRSFSLLSWWQVQTDSYTSPIQTMTYLPNGQVKRKEK